MHIQYYGLSCVKLTTKPGGRATEDVTIVINPFDAKGIEVRPPQLANVDIVLAAHTVEQYWSDAAEKSDAVAITTPGEYAISGVHIVGVAAQDAHGVPCITMYAIDVEGVKVGIVTGVAPALTAKHYEELSGTQILIIGVGGGDTLSPEYAAEVVRKVEPAYVVPVHYAVPQIAMTKKYASVDAFCTVLGAKAQHYEGKWVVRDKDCEGHVGDIMVIDL